MDLCCHLAVSLYAEEIRRKFNRAFSAGFNRPLVNGRL
jgi:hypothetical protein